jgi:hypothetical protein
MNSTVCKNCEIETTGNFCSNCGQKTDIHRLTIKHFGHELFHAFTHSDKGILLLKKELLLGRGMWRANTWTGKEKNPLIHSRF